MVHQKANSYFEKLFEIKKEMINANFTLEDAIWKKHYEQITIKGYNIENLPFLLALIHQDFYYRNGEYFGDNLPWARNKSFSNDITITNQCMLKSYIGIECVFNRDIVIRGKCEADHAWPNSLGGPSIKENRLILCKFHNGIKGYDISNYTWEKFPLWIKQYLTSIYSFKI